MMLFKMILRLMITPALMFILVASLSGCMPEENMPVNKKREVAFDLSTNQSPICDNGQVLYVKKDQVTSLPRLNSCLDPDNVEVIYTLVTPPTHGAIGDCLGLNPGAGDPIMIALQDLQCIYEPDENFEGSDSFTYLADDTFGGKTSVTVTITVASNHTPIFSGQSFSISEEKAVVQTLGEITPATDLDSTDILTYNLLTYPSKGNLSDCLGLNGSLASDLNCSYELIDGNTSDSFSVQVIDSSGATVTAEMTITIVDESAPTVSSSLLISYVKMNNGTQTLKSDEALTLPFLLDAGTDSDGDELSYRVSTVPLYGTLSACLDKDVIYPPFPDLACEYNPSTDFKGSDSFKYTISDHSGASTVVTVMVNVVNTIPFGSDFIVQVIEDGGPQAFDLGLGVNLGDVDGDLKTVVGTYPLNSSGVFDGVFSIGTLTNCLGLSGSSSDTDVVCDFTPSTTAQAATDVIVKYKLTDIAGESAEYNLKIKIRNINDGPSLADQTLTVSENGGAQNITLLPATDPDSDLSLLSYSVTLFPLAGKGTLTGCMGIDGASSQDLNCDYTPPANVHGVAFANFVVMVSDGMLESYATMAIDIQSFNSAPHFPVRNMTYTVTENTVGSDTATSLATFSPAVDGDVFDVLTYSLNLSPQGVLSNCLGLNGTAQDDLICDYLPTAGANGTGADKLILKVSDSDGSYDQLTVLFNITKRNFDPTFASPTQSRRVLESPGVMQSLLNPLPGVDVALDLETASDIDPHDTLQYVLEIPPGKGALQNCLGLNGSATTDLSCSYAINATIYPVTADIVKDQFDDFTYYAFDGQGGFVRSKVYINVTGVNQAPTITTISNQVAPKNSFINISTTIDEGGGIDENVQILTIKVNSSDETVIRNSDIKVYYGSSRANALTNLRGSGNAVLGVGDVATNAGAKKIYIDMIPIYNGSAGDKATTITLVVADNGTPAQTTTTTFTATVKDIVVTHGGWTAINAHGPTVLRDETTYGSTDGSNDTTVNLKWASPTTSGTSLGSLTVKGWNLYRNGQSVSDLSFDFSSPINGSTLISASSNSTYTDTSTEIQVDASATTGKVFWYRLRAILSDDSVVDLASSGDRTIRVLVPPRNKALVNRLMANKDICTKIGKTINVASYYSCSYIGPGNNASYLYDLGYDLIVDRFGIGCPYTTGETCHFWRLVDGVRVDYPADCITNSMFADPSATMSIGFVDADNIGDIYYDRTDGKCYLRTGVGSGAAGTAEWKDVSTYFTDNGDFGTSDNSYPNFSHLPPMTYLDQDTAYSFCSAGATSGFNLLKDDSTVYKAITSRLLRKKEYTAAASWSSTLSDWEIMNREAGNALTTTTTSNGCNSNNGGALAFGAGYLDTQTSPSFGTDVAYGRALWSGSAATNSCQSRYNLQDMVGNCWEWVSDRFKYMGAGNLTGQTASLDAGNSDFSLLSVVAPITYHLNGAIGPCDSSGDGSDCLEDAFVLGVNTDISKATRVFIPMGLPIVSTYSANSTYNLTTIGVATDQIYAAALHNDQVKIYADEVDSVVDDLGGVMVGGSYGSAGDNAGIFNFEVRKHTYQSRDVSFRCASPVIY